MRDVFTIEDASKAAAQLGAQLCDDYISLEILYKGMNVEANLFHAGLNGQLDIIKNDPVVAAKMASALDTLSSLL